jgi:2-oxoglutarate/2-oxoacid ferredoxin oxidoreductase subunit beta
MSKRLYKYLRPEAFPTPFCAGCGHGILMNAILRAIDELNLDFNKMVFVSGIGCGAWIPSPHFAADTLHTLHGRAIAYATGVKLANPALKVVVVSGDGDIAAIGGNHLIHAARRNITMTVICANNNIYGMTGGQVSPTTPQYAKTATTVSGNPEPPFDLCKVVAACGASYVARYTPYHIRPLTNSIKKALATDGFSFIDVISPCPTQYGRRNQMATLYDMLMSLKSNSINYTQAKTMPAEELKNKIIIGEFKTRDSD